MDVVPTSRSKRLIDNLMLLVKNKIDDRILHLT